MSKKILSLALKILLALSVLFIPVSCRGKSDENAVSSENTHQEEDIQIGNLENVTQLGEKYKSISHMNLMQKFFFLIN